MNEPGGLHHNAPGADRDVFALRRFRDDYLQSSATGRTLVRTYYAYGPTMAKAIRGSATARAYSRALLKPLADVANAISPLRAR